MTKQEKSERELIAENERLKTCLALAREVGSHWRNDWSDFDGRTLRDQMEDLRQVADGSMTGAEYREDWGLHG
jgi:hypothetical protein